MIVWFLRWTGMRVGEATSVRIRDLDFSPGRETITVANSKTAAGRQVVPLVPELLPLVRTWLDHLRLQGLYSADAFFEIPIDRLLDAEFEDLLANELADQDRFKRVEAKIGRGERNLRAV